ncbi:MAG TPA: acetyl-CoA carboxylase biotin carboxylase subunit [Firmicutes bacterium]|jgi:acetyl-CoA carboxylase biotin carboxylase subunit|nr:acetyl-CoA carboxylase biotin carboxylase subunit [Bacillota bacterium]HBE06546.1 acetyl-CoA carboxylase biotin carboxylase subunit [Bacillota bacterium]HBG45004.1 acetyl-CoA carboxylase biotin carboxylase subunit [Bacillota bacterium]HBL49481.1 acetyl-CoA carboxylase biotin carboxylase subunit [Bacillota bacterium]HBR25036.1 acetyl-CoA carboxylase biotin carboxylase subunit [Bacillota bacterium]
MFKRILVANRGEIAVRIIRAAREMGIETVAVYSEADQQSLHAHLADYGVCIGPGSSKGSYLNMVNIISAALLTGAEAIHPGFGFLSENASFARMCQECGLVFIGPTPEQIERMGDKALAKSTVEAAGVPVVPGSKGLLCSLDEARKAAAAIGYPILIKATAGGGGRGMRIAHSAAELEQAFQTAKMEAKAAFNEEGVYLEKLIQNPRHIEFQIMADHYGNIVHLGERDCSLQRRNQKVLEEAPSYVLSDTLRRKMGEAATHVAKAVNYQNAGTIEFLLDEDQRFYFIEMNTRIQVEHPITEMITGLDLVQEQIRVAQGEALSWRQRNIKFSGHAIECRINAEDPAQGFRPSAGRIESYLFPGGPGVRIDSAIYPGYYIPPYYDSMIAKLIVHGRSRHEAIAKMKMALEEFRIEGVTTNVSFQKEILNNRDFMDGNVDTHFIEKHWSR